MTDFLHDHIIFLFVLESSMELFLMFLRAYLELNGGIRS